MRPAEQRRCALALGATGLGASAIARRISVPRSTVRDWLATDGEAQPAPRCPDCGGSPHDFSRLPGEAYAYLLGIYLGDGCLSPARRGVFRLRVILDRRYPGIIDETAQAAAAILPDRRVAVGPHGDCAAVQVSAYSRQWPCLLPQHGSGRKHHRSIELTEWQRQITSRHPRGLVRGLIHSDGCRFINTVRAPRSGVTYRYPRYLFSNRSEDIKAILCEHLDLLGIEWRRVAPWDVSIARRAAVEAMDAFVGPKR